MEDMQDELRKATEHMQRMSQVQQQESAWRPSSDNVSLLDLKEEATVAVGGVDKYAVSAELLNITRTIYSIELGNSIR
jgi:hypothetical protein